MVNEKMCKNPEHNGNRKLNCPECINDIVDELYNKIELLEQENQRLQAEVKRLEEQLKLTKGYSPPYLLPAEDKPKYIITVDNHTKEQRSEQG